MLQIVEVLEHDTVCAAFRGGFFPPPVLAALLSPPGGARFSREAKEAARLIAVVVLPTPPF